MGVFLLRPWLFCQGRSGSTMDRRSRAAAQINEWDLPWPSAASTFPLCPAASHRLLQHECCRSVRHAAGWRGAGAVVQEGAAADTNKIFEAARA